jgi:hypothetical protein
MKMFAGVFWMVFAWYENDDREDVGLDELVVAYGLGLVHLPLAEVCAVTTRSVVVSSPVDKWFACNQPFPKANLSSWLSTLWRSTALYATKSSPVLLQTECLPPFTNSQPFAPA